MICILEFKFTIQLLCKIHKKYVFQVNQSTKELATFSVKLSRMR